MTSDNWGDFIFLSSALASTFLRKALSYHNSQLRRLVLNAAVPSYPKYLATLLQRKALPTRDRVEDAPSSSGVGLFCKVRIRRSLLAGLKTSQPRLLATQPLQVNIGFRSKTRSYLLGISRNIRGRMERGLTANGTL